MEHSRPMHRRSPASWVFPACLFATLVVGFLLGIAFAHSAWEDKPVAPPVSTGPSLYPLPGSPAPTGVPPVKKPATPKAAQKPSVSPTPTRRTLVQPSRSVTRTEPAAYQRWAAGRQATALRTCESSGNYGVNTGNGYYGAYQFDLQTWRSVGGAGYPHRAAKAEQDYRAFKLYTSRGWQPWPGCGRRLG